jgi:hypothetical protein
MHGNIFFKILRQTVFDKDMIIRLVVEQLMDLQDHLIALTEKAAVAADNDDLVFAAVMKMV